MIRARTLRRTARVILRRLGLRGPPADVSFVYHRRYRQGLAGVPMDPHRGERVLAHLLDEGWIGRSDVHEPVPAAFEALRLVHTAGYLRSLEDAEEVSRILGVPVGAKEAGVALDLQRLVVGGTVLAGELALRRRGTAFHLGGGLHHASPDRGSGFCLLNDVAVAVARLRTRGFQAPVLVVDLDVHDGNGTRAAFANDPTVHTFSIHGEPWDDRPAEADTSISLGAGARDGPYLETLLRELPPVVAAHRPEIVFYVAGADVARDDAYGGARLSPDAILERDRFVVECVRRGRRRLPLVVVLGGGYGPTAWRPTARFARWLVSGHVADAPDDVGTALRRVRWLEGQDDAEGNGAGAGWSLTPEDLGAVGPVGAPDDLLLGRFSLARIERDLERFGVLGQIRARGHVNPTVRLHASSGLGPTVRVDPSPEGGEPLVEVRLRASRSQVPGFTLLSIEWLLLQDPGTPFSPARPPLPGQEHPGLGVLADLVAWLVTICEEAGMDGLGFRSSHFHVAAIARRHLRFLEPHHERLFRRIVGAGGERPLAETAAEVAAGRLLDPETGEPFRWSETAMVVPVSDRLRRHLG